MFHYLFDQPLILTLVLVVVWSALFIRWRLKKNRGSAAALGLALLLGAAALAASLLLVTDRKIAQGVLNHLVKDIERDGLAASLAYVSPHFNDSRGTDYPGLQKDITVVSAKLILSGVELYDWQVERDAQARLDVHFTVAGRASFHGMPHLFGPDRWQVILESQGDGRTWKIVSAALVEGHLAGAPQVGNFRDLVSFLHSIPEGW